MPSGVSTAKRTTKKAASGRTAGPTAAKKPRPTAAPSAKTRSKARSTSGARAATTATRTKAVNPRTGAQAAPEPAPPLSPEVIAPLPTGHETPVGAVIVTAVPEPALAARVPAPEPPPPRPATRRGIFFDVENTSRAVDIGHVLAHLDIDWVGQATDFFAVGNWRVIGHDTARLLAQRGAALVHSAPSVGVRDWSDLRIAVGAGVWLAGARAGDVIEIVSDDQAFDAVGDVASSLGVGFRRTSYRALAGLAEVAQAEDAGESRRRSRRGGRGWRGDRERPERPRVERERTLRPAEREPAARPAERERHVSPPPPPRAAVAAPLVPDASTVTGAEPHTAPHDEIVHVVRDLLVTSPAGVSLDVLANALRSRGFSRPPGSPRLITRLRRIRELEIGRNGLIRLGEGTDSPEQRPHERGGHRHEASRAPAQGGGGARGTAHGARREPVARGGSAEHGRRTGRHSDAEWEAWAREAEEREAGRLDASAAWGAGGEEGSEAAVVDERGEALEATSSGLAHPLETRREYELADEEAGPVRDLVAAGPRELESADEGETEPAAGGDLDAGSEGESEDAETASEGGEDAGDANGSRKRRRRGGRRRRGRRGGSGQSPVPAVDGA